MPAPFAPCHQPTTTGHACRYPAGRCPLHTSQSPVPPNAEPDSISELNLRALAQTAIQRVFDGAVSPLQAARLVRALRSFQTVELDPYDREEALRRVELSGRLMYGVPPRDRQEWELARDMYDDDAIREFIRWAKHWHDPYPLDYDEQLGSPTWDPKYGDLQQHPTSPYSDVEAEIDDDDLPAVDYAPPARTATGRRP